MGLYNAINGVNQSAFWILPMLDKHPNEYPRFRDCFTSDEEHPEYDNHIHVYTRVGGGNRGEGYGEEELYKHPNYVTTFDDSFDNTYATYVFSVPEKWKDDFDKITSGNQMKISKEYLDKICSVFPKLESKFREAFKDH